MKAKVTVQNKYYNNEFIGLQFENGVAIVEGEAAVESAKRIASSFGYKFEIIDEPKAKAQVVEEVKSKPATRKKSSPKSE